MLPDATQTPMVPVLDRATIDGNPVFDRGDHLLQLTHPVFDRGAQLHIDGEVPSPRPDCMVERDPHSLTTDNLLGTAPPRALSAASADATLMTLQMCPQITCCC